MSDSLDDYDFTPSANSNLASLFDTPPENLESSSLIYTAPKQPKTAISTEVKNEPVKTESSSVIVAQVVQVWKLIDNKYVTLGRHGLAIIGSSVQNTYEMILYKEKRNVIVRVRLCETLEVSLKKDNFISFYDSLKEHWLLKFNNDDNCINILKQVEKFGAKIIKREEKNETLETSEKQEKINAAINDDSFDNKAKADILSRIAKMGQSILPNKNLDSDVISEDDNLKNISSSAEKTFETQSIIPPPSTVNAIQVPPRQHVQNIPSSSFYIGQPVTYDPLNLYFTENRTHNSEVRINLSQISEKLNHIMKLVETDKPTNDVSNETLKSKVKVLELKTENLSRELISFQEENIKLKQRIGQQEDILKAEEQNKATLSHIKEQEAVKIAEYERIIKTQQDNVDDLTKTVQKQKTEIDELRKYLEQHQETGGKYEDRISELNNTVSELNLKVKQFEEKQQIHNNSSASMDIKNKERTANFVTILKELMNGMYGNIVANFNEGKQYEAAEISSIIAQNIKSTTLKIIQDFQQIHINE